MVPPARTTERACVTMVENSWEGESRRYLSEISEAGEEDLEKKRRPSVVGCVKAERRDDM